MKRITLAELKQLTEDARGSISKIFLHWSAGHYGSFFNDYHINIDKNGEIYASTDDLSEKKAHTWNNNTAAVGITLACCYRATPENLGDEPPTPEQIESMAQVVAVICDGAGIPCDYEYVRTHAEQATVDGYGPGSGDPETRWDLMILSNEDLTPGGDIIRGKANWYINKWNEEGL